MKIAIVGTGYVGLVTGTCLAEIDAGNIVLVFLVGLSAGFCYLIAGISVVTEVLSIGFGISTDWTMKSAIITTVVFVLLPHIGMGIVAVIEVVKCGLQDFIFG